MALPTYGTMAAKMSIKDVARVLDLPLSESNALAKLVPEKPKITMDRIFNAALSGDNSLSDKEANKESVKSSAFSICLTYFKHTPNTK